MSDGPGQNEVQPEQGGLNIISEPTVAEAECVAEDSGNAESTVVVDDPVRVEDASHALDDANRPNEGEVTTEGAAEGTASLQAADERPPSEHVDDSLDNAKRPRDDDDEGESTAPEMKLLKTDDMGDRDDDPIPASKEGTSFFNDADVLSGRGGGTNVHPGNRNFRDLINLHRRAYLKARKNDKPAISRAIVRSIRDNNGRFLRKDDKTGLWFEIGDDAAREKTSQALRQRAPEMRKLLFDTEREEARSAAEDHLRHQRMMMGMPPDAPPGVMPPGMQMPPMAFPNPAFFQAMAANGGKPPGASPNGQDPYQMFQAAIMNNNMPRFPTANGGGS
jgi:hypothetical protein